MAAKPMVINEDLASIAAGSLFDTGMELHRNEGLWKVTRLTVTPHSTVPLQEFLTSEAAAWHDLKLKIDPIPCTDGAYKLNLK